MNEENLDKSITLRELLEHCKSIDDNGKVQWPDHEFEGQSVFCDIYYEIFGEWLSGPEIHKYFGY